MLDGNRLLATLRAAKLNRAECFIMILVVSGRRKCQHVMLAARLLFRVNVGRKPTPCNTPRSEIELICMIQIFPTGIPIP
jgi:hypothetical protein